ncbi:MAG: DEAD/DEAH box helicase [Motiliproteus sp.]|nr:DEAD/DEAH box helicase [Motiliproteus sp.]
MSSESSSESEVKNFTDLNLNDRLHKALDKLEYEMPTPVQAEAIPHTLAGKDLMVNAETGSGKTAAFLLPILQKLVTNQAPNSATRALILLPTRELARQVLKHCNDLMAFTHIKAVVITGGAEFKYQQAMLRKNPEIIIATPGRLVEHLTRNSIDLSDLEILVLDEADRMLDLGFSEDVLRIASASPEQRQTLLYSATLNHKGVRQVASEVLSEPMNLTLNRVQDGHDSIRQQVVLADDIKHKQRLLVRLLEQENAEKTLVFCNTRDQASRLAAVLKYHGLRAAVLHGEMEQDERNRVMDLMRRGQLEVLVATDVAARGLDVKGIELVVNFDMPRSGDDHVHRVGRTGRAGVDGTAISLIKSNEWNLMASIERYLKISFERRLVKGLEGKYKGPKKLKSSGKAASDRKRSESSRKNSSKKDGDKTKQRHRDRKSVGKRRAPSASNQDARSDLGDGFAPLKKRKDKEQDSE